MFTKIQYRILSLFAGGTFLTSLLASTLAGGMINQGTPGSTGPQGPSGEVGPQGPSGEDGRDVEFDIDGSTLQWRYIGDTVWSELELPQGSGSSGSIVNTGGSTAFSHWIFAEEALNIPFPTLTADPVITNSATYAAAKVSEGFTAINTLAGLVSIKNNMSGKYVLTANIDLANRLPADVEISPFSIVNGGLDANFNQIPFSGILDGAGYSLSNFTMDNTVDGYTFGQIYNSGIFDRLAGATIKNLQLNAFTYKASNQAYNIGPLAGEVLQSSVPTIIDNVRVNDLSLESVNNGFYIAGGLIGRTSNNSSLRMYRTSVSNMTVEADTANYTYYSGGLIGYVNGNVIIGDSSAISSYDSAFGEGSFHQFNYIGGAIGEISWGGSVQVDNSDFTLNGQFHSNVGGFAGYLSGASKLSFINSTTTVDLIPNITYGSGYRFGGILGEVESDTLVLINQAQTNGTIKGNNTLGGYIAFVDGGSLIRIENSVNSIDLFGREYVGGVLGRTNDDDYIKVLLDNVEVRGSISNYVDYPDFFNTSLDRAGGFIGYLDSSDTSNQSRWNQFWIRNSTISNMTFNLQPLIVEGVDGSSDLLFTNQSFEAIGGAIGEIYEYVFVRMTNNDITTTLEYAGENLSFYNGYLGFYDIGGLIGYAEYFSDIQLLNNQVNFSVNVNFNNNLSTVETPNTSYFSFDMYRIGGAFGYMEEGQIIDVAGNYALDVNLNFNQNDWDNFELGFQVYDIGGYIGQLDSETTLIADAIAVGLSLDLSLALIANPIFTKIQVDLYNIGEFIGSMSAFAFLRNITTETSTDVALPNGLANLTINTIDFDALSFTGNSFTFFVLTTSN